MNRRSPIFLTILLISQAAAPAFAASSTETKTLQQSQGADGVLTNQQVIALVRTGIPPETLLAKIRTSKSNFDLSKEKLEELTLAGVPAAVIVAMAEGPRPVDSNQQTPSVTPAKLEAVLIPDGTLVEIEAPYTFSSLHFKPKDEISFRVVNPLKANGVTVIEQGATATGRIERAKRGGHWGKAGLLTWTMQSVTAVDGSQIPLRLTQSRIRGDSKGAKVATGMILTGALLPLIAPVALLHGFKRGGDAYIPAGKRYEVYVQGEVHVKAAIPR
jgi:hypothetical protein